MQQRRIPHGIDLADPPMGYSLVGISCEGGRELGGNAVRFGIEASNLFNTEYRDYMDRFRYFADARGTDVRVWLAYAFNGIPKKDKT